MHSSIILGGYILDLIFGDPAWPGHPVRLIGRLIEVLEKKLNSERFDKVFSGAVLAILVIMTTATSIWGILKLSRLIHPYFCYLISTLLIYFALSIKQLAIEANKVYSALNSRDMTRARKELAMIVGRDTDNLDEPQIVRATVETVAESTMDGIVSPLFYAFLGGPLWAWIYKAINTLDSMVGYRSERYIDFGKAAANLDALVNFIPAKITSYLISLSAFCCGKDAPRAMALAGKYLFKGPNANSESTEAAMAAALGVQLGGLNFYNSAPISKSLIGDGTRPLEIKHIQESIRIAYFCSFIFLFIAVIASAVKQLCF